MAGQNQDEFWDVYTRDREKTGRFHKRGEQMDEGEYHLVVHVCIFNSKNQLLIQQRQPFKEGWPNMWDLSVGGSAVQGDSSYKAAEREVLEELGISLDLSDKRPQFTINFGVGFDDYYLVEKDIDISELQLQKEEVQAVKWADKEEVMQMQAQGIMIPYWFSDKLFELRDFYDARGDRRKKIKIGFAEPENLMSWMSLAEVVRDHFPGLETEELLEDYKNTVIKNINRKSAVCALDGNMVVGILLYSTKHNILSCMAVHPDYRRQGIATKMVEWMLPNMNQDADITVETFRAEDEKGTAPRAFYQSLGFEPGELCMSQGYPCQIFVRRAGSGQTAVSR